MEKTTYSFKKGFIKGLVSVLSVAGGLVAFAGFSDIAIWDLVEQYIKPVFGALTVGGVITIAVNYLKIKLS